MPLDPYGLSRVVGEPGVLPQRAQRLDPSLPLHDDELLIDVERLNVDAASFRQFRESQNGDPQRMADAILKIVEQRGKLQNPVTGSGGMLLGRVRQVGPAHPAHDRLQPGDRLLTLVTLTLTPHALRQIRGIDLAADRVDVEGHAILFGTGLYAKLPSDLPEPLVLAALDVCGAPALAARYVQPGARVLIIGAGKSGALCCAQARRSGASQILACDIDPHATSELALLGLAEPIVADATQPLALADRVRRLTQGALCDVVINVANLGGTEKAALLSVRERGWVIFFSMATSFTAAALGAEGIGKDATLIIGNGYSEGHAELTLDLVRQEPAVRELLERRFL